MSTNKIVLRSVEEFLGGFVPTYRPIMPMFLGEGRARQYSVEVGKIDFKIAQTVGDLRARLLSPKDSEIFQVASNEKTKTFKKHFFGAQYVQSSLQDQRGVEDVMAQVLDEHNKQNDEIFLFGEGTSAGNVVNNGLFWSADENYELKTSAEIELGADGKHQADLYEKITDTLLEADDVDGQKMVMIYGDDAVKKFNGLLTETSQPLSTVMRNANPGVSFARMPKTVTPAGVNGYMVVNMNQILTHYCLIPRIDDQGVDAKMKQIWTNFLMGSSMVEVKADKGIIRQPITFEAP